MWDSSFAADQKEITSLMRLVNMASITLGHLNIIQVTLCYSIAQVNNDKKGKINNYK